MKLIHNSSYCFTRHNAGFMVLDKWALDNNISFREEKKLKCFIAKMGDNLLIKPTTFMNLSGEAVRAVMDYYKIEVKDILIVYDDIALDLGRIRFRANGSDGGTKEFDRLKIGIGPQPNIPSENYVLQNFPKEQHDELKNVLIKADEAIEFYLENGIQKAQNQFN